MATPALGPLDLSLSYGFVKFKVCKTSLKLFNLIYNVITSCNVHTFWKIDIMHLVFSNVTNLSTWSTKLLNKKTLCIHNQNILKRYKFVDLVDRGLSQKKKSIV